MRVSELRLPDPLATGFDEDGVSEMSELDPAILSPSLSAEQAAHSVTDISSDFSSLEQSVHAYHTAQDCLVSPLQKEPALPSKPGADMLADAESIASGPGESITGYRQELRRPSTPTIATGGLRTHEVETESPSIAAVLARQEHPRAPCPHVDNVRPWLHTVRRYQSRLASSTSAKSLPGPDANESFHDNQISMDHGQIQRPDAIEGELTSAAASSLIVGSDDASVSIPHLASTEGNIDALSLSSRASGAIGPESLANEASLHAGPPGRSESCQNDKILAGKDLEGAARSLSPVPCATQLKSGSATWLSCLNPPKSLLTVLTVTTAFCFVVDLIPRVSIDTTRQEDLHTTQFTESASATSSDYYGIEPLVAAGYEFVQHSLPPSSTEEIPPQARNSIFVIALLAFASAYGVYRALTPKKRQPRLATGSPHRKINSRRPTPSVVSSMPSTIDASHVRQAIASSRRSPAPLKSEALIVNAPVTPTKVETKPIVRKAEPEEPARTPSPTPTVTPLRRKSSSPPPSDRVTRSMSKPQEQARSTPGARKGSLVSPSKRRSTPLKTAGSDCPDTLSSVKRQSTRQASVPATDAKPMLRSAHWVFVHGDANVGKRTLLSYHTGKALSPCSSKEGLCLEGTTEAAQQTFEKGDRSVQLVYRPAGLTHRGNLLWEKQNAGLLSAPRGRHVRLFVYSVVDQASRAAAFEEALQYLTLPQESNTLICIIANKCDLLPSSARGALETQIVEKFLQVGVSRDIIESRVAIFCTCAVSGYGINDAFRNIARTLRNELEPLADVEPMEIDRRKDGILVY